MYIVFIPLAFLTVQLVNLLGVAVFSAVRSWPQLIAYGLLFFVLAYVLGYLWIVAGGAMCLAIIEAVGVTFTMSHLLPRLHLNSAEFIQLSSYVVLALFFMTITSWLFARCNLSPYSTNRMQPLRRWFSVAIVLSFLSTIVGIGVGNAGAGYNAPSFLLFWMLFVVGVLSVMLIIGVCERESWEGRLQRDIPQSRWRRALVFPFYTGSINALLWVFLWTVFAIAVVSASTFTPGYRSRGGEESFLEAFASLMILMYVFNCSMTAFCLWKILLQRWVPREMIWTVSLTLIVGGYISVIVFFNLVLHIDIAIAPILVVGGIILWFLATVAISGPWLKDRFHDFTPILERETWIHDKETETP